MKFLFTVNVICCCLCRRLCWGIICYFYYFICTGEWSCNVV